MPKKKTSSKKKATSKADQPSLNDLMLDREIVKISDLKSHPRNYREHPEDQLEHIIESVVKHKLYRNIVVARDSTILAGHGVTLALEAMGHVEVPVVRLDLDPNEPAALSVLVGDNEIEHLAVQDDRLLSEILKELSDADMLTGTGYDRQMLANLAMVTRPASEVATYDAATEWVGMPDYDADEHPTQGFRLQVHFRSAEDRKKLLKLMGVEISDTARSTWYPPKERETPGHLKFDAAKNSQAEEATSEEATA